jgi:hypothetical protein
MRLLLQPMLTLARAYFASGTVGLLTNRLFNKVGLMGKEQLSSAQYTVQVIVDAFFKPRVVLDFWPVCGGVVAGGL